MERQQFIDNELENYIKQFPDATDAELDDIFKSSSITFDSQIQTTPKEKMTIGKLRKLEEESIAAQPRNPIMDAASATGTAVGQVIQQAPSAAVGTAGMLTQFPVDILSGLGQVSAEIPKRLGIISPETAAASQEGWENMAKAYGTTVEELKKAAQYTSGEKPIEQIIQEEATQQTAQRQAPPEPQAFGVPGANRFLDAAQGLASLPFQPAITTGHLIGGAIREATGGESPELQAIRENAGQEIANLLLSGSAFKGLRAKAKALDSILAKDPTTLTPEEQAALNKYNEELNREENTSEKPTKKYQAERPKFTEEQFEDVVASELQKKVVPEDLGLPNIEEADKRGLTLAPRTFKQDLEFANEMAGPKEPPITESGISPRDKAFVQAEIALREANKAITQALQAEAKQRKANVEEGMYSEPSPSTVFPSGTTMEGNLKPFEGMREGGREAIPNKNIVNEIRDNGFTTKAEVMNYLKNRIPDLTMEDAADLLDLSRKLPLRDRVKNLNPPFSDKQLKKPFNQLFKKESPTATEPPPQNMEATTEFLTRKPAVTIGEAERLKGEVVPTGGMTINRQARPTVTLGGEGERTGEAIPEGKGMTVQPTAPSNKLDQLFKREPSRLDNYVKNFVPRDKTRIKNQLQTIDKIADEYGNIEILYDEKAKPQYKLSTKDGKEYRRINKTEYEYLKSIGKETIEAKKPLQFSDLENMSDEEILAIPERELEKVARAESVPFRDRVDFNIRLNKIKSSIPSPQPQQATEVAPKDITPQPAEPTAVKTPEVKEPSNVEIAQQNFNRIMNAQPYELTLEDYIYQKRQKARVYRKPTGQKDRQEMKIRIREVGDQYAPDEHKAAVKQALSEGKPVPPEVLAEYPDLKVEQKVKTKEKPQKNIIKNEIIDKINVTPPKQIGERSVSAVDGEALLNLSFAEEQTKNALNNGIISRNDFDYINKKIKNFKDRVNSNERGLLPYIEKLNEQIKEATQPRPKTGPGMFEGAELQNEEISKKTDWSAPYSKLLIDENDARFIERFKQKGIDINLAKIAGSIEKMPKELLTKLAEGYDIGSDAVEALYRYVKGEKKPEITKYFNNKGEEVQHNPEAYGEIELTLTNNGHSISNTPPKGTKAREVIDRIIKEHEEKNNLDIMQNIAGDTTIGTLKDWLKGPDATEMFKDVLDTQVIIRPEGPTNTTVAWVPSDGEAIYLNSSRIKTVGMRYLKNAITHEAQHLLQVKKGQKIGGQNYLPYKERPAEIEAHAVGEKYRTGRLSMLGAGTLQNAYEKVEPALKKGADMLFKKGKQAYETVKRNADLTRDMGRVVDITEKEGRPVETEYQPRFIKSSNFKKGAISFDPLVDTIKKAYREGREKVGKLKESFQKADMGIADNLYTLLFERFHPVLKPIKKTLGKKRLESVFGTIERSRYADNVMRLFGKTSGLFENMAKKLQDANLDLDDLGTYAQAARVYFERSGRKIQSRLTKDQAFHILNNAFPDKQKATLKMVFDDLQKQWQDVIVKELVDSQVFDPAKNDYLQKNKNYSRDVVIEKILEDILDKGDNRSKDMMQFHLKGTSKDILNPVEQMIQYAHSLAHFSRREVAKKSVVDALKDAGIASDTAKEGYELVKYKHKGEWVEKYLPSYMASTLMDAPAEMHFAVKWLDDKIFNSKISKAMTRNIIVNPSFAVGNSLMLDPITTWAQMPSVKGKFLYPIVHALTIFDKAGSPYASKLAKMFGIESLKDAEKKMTEGSMFNVGSLYSKATGEATELSDMMSGLGLNQNAVEFFTGKKANLLKKAYGGLETAVSEIDNTSKVSLYRYLQAFEAWRGNDKIAEMVREMGTPATKRSGAAEPILRRGTLFGNAILQAGRATAKNFADSPVQFTFSNMAVPTALAYGIYNYMTSDPENKKRWDSLSEYQKKNFINIDTGLGTKDKPTFFSLPLPRIARIFYGIALDILENDKSFLKIADSVASGLAQGALSELPSGLSRPIALATDVGQYALGKNPYDFYRKQNVIPQNVMDADATVWNKLMGDSKLNDLSTTKAFGKYLLNTYGLAGWWNLDALNNIPAGSEWTKAPGLNRLFRVGGAGVSQKLYEAKKQPEKIDDRARLIISNAVKEAIDNKTNIKITSQVKEAIARVPDALGRTITNQLVRKGGKQGNKYMTLIDALKNSSIYENMEIFKAFEKMK